MPTLDPLYTDHQSTNLLKYHVVHLTRSSPAPTISLFLHIRRDLARYCRVCKCCVTYLLTYYERGKFIFVLQICSKTILRTTMQNSKNFPGTMPRTPVLGERKLCFHSPKWCSQNYPTAMQISKTFPGTIPWTPF